MTPFQEQVYRIVAAIPRGRIASYGGVALLAGHPRAARAVGSALSAIPDPEGIPWWRVVSSEGTISTSRINHVAQLQRALLEAEGVEFGFSGRISWERFGWSGTTRSPTELDR